MEDEHLQSLIEKYRQLGLVIDSNLLLLYLIGKFEPSLIRSFRRTQQFSEAEFQLLTRFVGLFVKVLTLPNILTEVSNLAGQLPENTALEFRESFRESIHLLDERYCESNVAVAQPMFSRVGLTDAALASVSAQRHLVLTDDFRLTGLLAKHGIDVINFNHIRVLAW